MLKLYLIALICISACVFIVVIWQLWNKFVSKSSNDTLILAVNKNLKRKTKVQSQVKLKRISMLTQ